jgi:hypothetical protein
MGESTHGAACCPAIVNLPLSRQVRCDETSRGTPSCRRALGDLLPLVAIGGGAGYDSHAYWLTRHGIRYLAAPGRHDAYLYSPAFAQVIRPLTLLPWPVFGVIWASLATATYLWLVLALEPRWRIAILALCLGDIVYGNVWWLLTLTLVFGLRRPALWAVPVLLKLTPAVGLIWFAARREWRNLGVAITVVAVVTAVSLYLAPGAWMDWAGLLGHGHATTFPDTPLPRAVRLIAAFALTVCAARSDRPRLLPVALLLAAPMFSLNGIAVFAALAHLEPARRSARLEWGVARRGRRLRQGGRLAGLGV